MKILLDCRFQKGAGPNVTSQYLVDHLLRCDTANRYIILQHRQQHFPELPNVKKIYVPTQKRWAEFLWVQFVLPRILKHESVNIYHSLKHFGPLFTSIPKIEIVREVRQFLGSAQRLSIMDLFYWKVIGRIAWKRATRIHAISNICRKVLIERVGIPGSKIKVIHHGVHEKFRLIPKVDMPSERLARFGVKGPYFLCVGNPYPHKNYETAIRTLHVLKKKVFPARHHKLLIVGDLEYAYLSLYKIIEELNLKDDVIFTNFVDHDELVYLYNKAEVLLFCSLYEGFGNPPLEAMACGLPVVAANRGAVGEVTGSASILIEDPLDYKAFVLAIEKVLTDHTHRKRMIEEGLRRAAELSWNKAAQKVLNLYAELFEEGHE